MKIKKINPFLSLIAAGLFFSCGSDESSNSNDSENSDSEEVAEFTPPDCPSTEINYTVNEYSWESKEIKNTDYSFTVLGTAGSYYNNRLDFMIGDADNDGMDMYDYLDTCGVCVQITLDNPEIGEYNVADLGVPVQPYVAGRSKSIFGTSSSFPDAVTEGTIAITELSEEWVCGSIDIIAFHGGVVKGSFSTKLYPKF